MTPTPRRRWANWRSCPACANSRCESNAPRCPGIPCRRRYTASRGRYPRSDAMSLVDWLNKPEQQDATSEPAPDGLEGRVIAALRTVYDPELPVNIFDLGLVYRLDVDEAAGKVQIRMTLTAPGCPVAQTFPATVEGAVEAVQGVNEARGGLGWGAPWSRDRMREAARLDLGMI